MIKTLAKELIPEELIRVSRIGSRIFRVSTHNFKTNPAVIVYAMAKSGTSTVETTLYQAGIPVYKVHRLSYDGIRLAEDRLRSNKNPRLLNIHQVAKVLRKRIEGSPEISWKVISLTREPIAQAISGLFQGIEYHQSDLIDENGEIKVDKAIHLLQDRFAQYANQSANLESSWYDIEWFDRELKAVFDIDVYQYPYDFEQGYSIIKQGNVELLITRMEDLDRSFSQAITQFLQLAAPPEIKRENVGTDKKFRAAYSEIKKNIQIPVPICEAIYSSTYARHFYTQEERNTFLKKWSSPMP